MQRLSEVPNSVLPSLKDIRLYILIRSRWAKRDVREYLYVCTLDTPAETQCSHSRKGGSSLKGQRTITDFFYTLDHIIQVINTYDYQLHQLDNNGHPLAIPPVERLSAGNIVAGDYLISKSPWL